jgi:dUTP pyrophosphatase
MRETIRIGYWLVSAGLAEPERNFPGDAGYDFMGIRAVVHPKMMDPEKPFQRLTLFDFSSFPNDRVLEPVSDKNSVDVPVSRSVAFRHPEFVYRLAPEKIVHLGLGIVFDLAPGFAGYIQPRSRTIWSSERNCRLEILNDTVPIDSGFRGEVIAVLLNHGPETFEINRFSRICQFVLNGALYELVSRKRFGDLSLGDRRFGCNGSTGLEGR